MAIKKHANGSWVSASYRKYGTETDAITTLPATVIGDGTPISSYTIKGNTVQNGTPTPENPIVPQECGERTANLFSTTFEQGTTGGGALVPSENRVRSRLFLLGTGTFTFSCANNDNFQIAIDYHLSNGSYSSGTSWLTTKTFDLTAQTPIIRLKIRHPDDSAMTPADVENAMLNSGSTSLPYEPYGYKLPLTLGSTTTDIYLGEVQSTRRIKKLVLTGQETYQNYSYASTNGVQIINMFETAYRRASGLCNIYPVSTVAGGTSCVWIGSGGGDRNLYFVSILSDMGMSTADEFKSYVQQQYAAGTPVTVWYVLAEPETGIVNEPLMKIGDYVDSVSGTNLATSGTAQEFDVGTTLKPSEVDLTYHGWHEHEDTKYST